MPDDLRLDFLDRSSVHYLLSIPNRLFPYSLAELANLSFSPSTEFSLDSVVTSNLALKDRTLCHCVLCILSYLLSLKRISVLM